MKGLGVMTGKICIDTTEGEALAKELGYSDVSSTSILILFRVFDEGMPHIRMFNSYDKGFAVHAGKVIVF